MPNAKITASIAIVWIVMSVPLVNWGWGQSTPMPGSQPNLASTAIAGEPFGVGQIEIPAGQIASDATVRLIVAESNDRILYPAVEIVSLEPEPEAPRPSPPPGGRRIGNGVVINRIREAIQRAREHIDPPEVLRVHFLFTGSEPLHIQITGDVAKSFDITPFNPKGKSTPITSIPDPVGAYKNLLMQWWNGYVQQAKRQIERSDYPTLIESYLVHLLGNRFGFEPPDLLAVKDKKKKPQTDPLPTLSLVAGIESLRAEIAQRHLTSPTSKHAAHHPIPPAPRFLDLKVPDAPPDLKVELIAQAVPPECFYLRFGSFANYLWFQQIGETRSGDLAQLAMLRGFNYEANDRVQRMLNTQMTLLSKLFGDSVISDMAIIGNDLYMQEGPTMGVVMQAKNFSLLQSSLTQERTSTLKRLASQGCKVESIDIGGQQVSFLSTPDNQIRSFYVESDPFIFITTSRELAKRFIEIRKNGQSMANSPGFRFVRLMMPLENNYDMFVYLSSEFFRNLVSPHYQIELRRRLQAIAAIEMAEMAGRVADAERTHGIEPGRPKLNAGPATDSRIPTRDIQNLMRDGYLPEWFQNRVDGSETLMFDGHWHDSVRGRRGSFLPIADVPVVDCSDEELATYREAANFYATKWQQTDPMVVGIRRFEHPELPKVERIAIEAYIAPLGSDKYGWIGNFLAPAIQTRIDLPPDDVINVQIHMAGQRNAQTFTPNHTMFAGLKDLEPPLPEEAKGLLAMLRLLKSLPAYVGAWPRPGYLDNLPLGLGGGPPDILGFSRTIVGLWRWQMGGFSVISFDRSILENCAMHLKIVPATDFAQGRVLVRNLSTSKLSSWFNTYSFRQAAQTTRGNLMLLDSLEQQLNVPREDAMKAAEELLDAKLQCSLGGQYKIQDGQWISTAWPTELALAPNAHPSTVGYDTLHTVPPKSYRAPWLDWFRGAELHVTQLPERLVLIGQLDMEPLPPRPNNGTDAAKESALPKMNFDLYNLPFQFFQGDKPKDGAKSDKDKANNANEKKRSF